MAKKVMSFAEKMKKSEEAGAGREFVKYVKSYKSETGSWRFRTKIVQVTDENRKEIYG
jgi:hypothetical protein